MCNSPSLSFQIWLNSLIYCSCLSFSSRCFYTWSFNDCSYCYLSLSRISFFLAYSFSSFAFNSSNCLLYISSSRLFILWVSAKRFLYSYSLCVIFSWINCFSRFLRNSLANYCFFLCSSIYRSISLSFSSYASFNFLFCSLIMLACFFRSDSLCLLIFYFSYSSRIASMALILSSSPSSISSFIMLIYFFFTSLCCFLISFSNFLFFSISSSFFFLSSSSNLFTFSINC